MGAYKVQHTSSSKLRETLDFPVIDTDGHVIESEFVLPDFLKQVGGPSLAERYQKVAAASRNPDEPKRVPWGFPSGPLTLDRATMMLPQLCARRLEEAGVDFTTLYSTAGFRAQVMTDDELRQGTCRALNMMYADMYQDVSDKMTPAAVIPMHTPQEAIAEVEFAVNELGMRALMTCNEVVRPHPKVLEEAPHLAPYARTYTPIALDSTYDYDPFWAKCVEFKVVPAGHSMNFIGTHQSSTNYIYNRLGFFATGGNAACRALFMSGFTQKFPELNVAFLEGGVWWAVALYNDLFEFWEKRNKESMLTNLDPEKIDFELLEDMFALYGNDYLNAERMMANKKLVARDGRSQPGEIPDFIDDWTQVKIEQKEDIRDLFVNNFYFGCEADDAMNYTAFNAKANKFGAKLKAMFSSDLGHWDVQDFGGVLAETYEAVERGLMSEEDFKDFVFTNPVTLQTRLNPDYFKGTCVEGAVSDFLAAQSVAG
ncbi:amidohydrolase family protein [Candidatus Entotheonella palauensis]|nr:amidohydrolase family protein [Candidatus Entotheonella palauensis]